ncbi:MAG: 30S ribosomal protein S9 [Candidatus Wolfebacteria bacterium GW2011_GWA2_42_10]|uniref:Small ribosomal subunit protein uS9 n=2 Tax=Candidatus Wolfeibacteriota TaxID=1752735 RepID=A0A0G1AJT2_9BACT|nr:MAG: 30S ribosomal protein S9 [Candidatus Wolfebacteria bacterium GW2011_GWB1_41_12]KKS25543.1 MAG: 30S ribosomal protein S9 [Candidatus Wolfebacteria bacterium GW2011_GWA2_42_10]KKT56570.1 MAG: 30S ribosomal protein S9 [Candidatus Wolfebacteria bacterium GW2011_GWA1_44_24]
MTEKISKTKIAKEEKTAPAKKEHYFEAVGRRKTAIARVRLYTRKNGFIVNEKDPAKYFPLLSQRKEIIAPIEKMKIGDKLGVIVRVKGGGLSAQAEAVRLGIARALVKFNQDFKKRLRRVGYLTRDSRMVERKKYGRHKARRGHQWRKR